MRLVNSDDGLQSAPAMTEEEWDAWRRGENVEPEQPPLDLTIVSLDKFADVNEPGAEALVGDPDDVLIPQNGDVMMYGDGGAGKTTLAIDLAFHLAASDDWLGITIPRPVRVLLVENEGPRPLFRAKLRRKRDGWKGGSVGDRLSVVEAPWARLDFTESICRSKLAEALNEHETDVVIVGPVTRAGMNEAGTLQQVRDFMALVDDVRDTASRPVTFILIHHENKGGQVSGAWEGSGDTLLHVTAQGNGHTRLYVQKARWSSSHHATTIHLVWTDGEGFAVADEPVKDDNELADELLEVVYTNGGASWNKVEEQVEGKAARKRAIRDRLLEGGRLINTGGGRGMSLWHIDDPAKPALYEQLRPERDAPGDVPASPQGPGEKSGCVPDYLRSSPGDAPLAEPLPETNGPVDDADELERLQEKHWDLFDDTHNDDD